MIIAHTRPLRQLAVDGHTALMMIAPSNNERRSKLRPLVLGLIGGTAVMGLLVFAVLLFSARGALPLVTEESLAAAMQRWEDRGPKSYRLSLLVTGTRPGPVELEVRRGEPVRLTRDGREPARHTWDFWTIDGQLEAIEGELTGDVQTMFGVPDRSAVLIRGEFDPDLGYPRKYQRQVLGRDLEVGWEVQSFVPLD